MRLYSDRTNSVYIDTRNSEEIVVGLGGKKVVTDSREGKAQMLLGVIDSELKRRGRNVKDIESIEVETGPGSFTGLRVGVSVANALGWTLGIPVNKRDVEKEGLVEPVY